MAAVEARISTDQKKLIVAIALGLGAIIALWWTFFGFGGSSKPQQRKVAVTTPATTPGSTKPQVAKADENSGGLTPEDLRPIIGEWGSPSVPEAHRNIFAYYEPPVVQSPPPTPPPPTPTPPLLLAAISPSNVYARTAEFSLDVTGDKFTPAVRVFLDGRELPTRFKSPQQLSGAVSAAMIANPGQRSVIVRSSDNTLYSNTTTLVVTAPPTPNYTYVGIIGKPRHVGDTALLQDKNSKEIVNAQRGDVLGGRFRITSISDRELVLVDTNLMIKHTLPLTGEGDKGFPQGRQQPKVASEDDDP